MKLVDVKCIMCGTVREEMVDNSVAFGDVIKGADDTGAYLDELPLKCSHCKQGAGFTVLVSCCPVRTPMNSASFLDGYRDQGHKFNHQCRINETDTAAERAFQQGSYEESFKLKAQVKELAKHTS